MGLYGGGNSGYLAPATSTDGELVLTTVNVTGLVNRPTSVAETASIFFTPDRFVDLEEGVIIVPKRVEVPLNSHGDFDVDLLCPASFIVSDVYPDIYPDIYPGGFGVRDPIRYFVEEPLGDEYYIELNEQVGSPVLLSSLEHL